MPFPAVLYNKFFKAMTEKEAMTKPLHEVWEYFKSLQSMVAWPLKTKTDRMFVMQLQEEKKMLRRILLERIVRDYELEVRTVVYGGEMREMVCCSEQGRIYFTAFDAKNYGAAWSFIAWELEQRRKEQEGGSHD